MFGLEGKHCLITGGAGSLGREAARLAAADGARVALIDRDETGLERAAGALPGDRVTTVVADVSSETSVQKAVAQAVAGFGKIDVVFSNAGNFGVVKPIGDFPTEVFDSVYGVHVRGAFLLCKYAVPQMNDGGSIVITSSVAGITGDPGVHAYITAKHAQVGLMRCLAKELAPRRIRVNTLHPGPIDNGFQSAVEDDLGNLIGRDATAMFNELIPLGRHASVKEVASSFIYLASDMSSFTTGSTLMVDGGMSV